ncbi:MAG: M90 family metallopeptidase [Betaproteobacteria bacterium]
MAWSLRQWRRERALARGRVDDGIWDDSLARFSFARNLSDPEQLRLREQVTLFLDDKDFTAAGGLELTDQMCLDVALQACILILNLDVDSYRGWTEVIVYPDEFVPGHTWTDDAGVVHHDPAAMAGEAWLQGPVVLSWADVARSGADDGVNVVIHEFAHKLDMLNGDANGFPPLHKGMSRVAWSRTFEAAYLDFCRRVDAGRHTEIDPYASESPGEFFAVLSEAFFEIPVAVVQTYPDVYEQLRQFYRQDPLERLGARAH